MEENNNYNKVIKSLFLGPKAENQELYESLIIEIIKDSCFLRKNFHPADLPVISETDKLSDDFQLTAAELKQELQNILAELKRGVPLYHPRYIGHMHGDLLISAIAGYFGTLLYNSNNIVGESSPATTRMEFNYISKLAQMVGYKPMINADNNVAQSWGHLSAGGTTANMEALWVARNMKYYPIAVKIASLKENKCLFVKNIHENFHNKTIKELSFKELFNLSPKAISDLKDSIYKKCTDNNLKVEEIKELISQYEVINLGVHGIHQKVIEVQKEIQKIENPEILELPKLYYAKSYHYSWDKAIDLIGIGHHQIVKVPIDSGFRLNFKQFREIYDKNSSTLAVIGILGSSKQGSIDPIDDLVQFRKDLEQNEKKSFHLHVDGAYGGYFPCLLKTNDNQLITANELVESIKMKENDYDMPFDINKKWYKKVDAAKYSDSITIDPHKMGYIPYPTGSIIFSDTRCKDFISYLPSYLNKPSESKDISEEFLGQWTLEGSRPGAAATACYLAEKVLPYHKDAHGIIVKNTIQAAMLFWKSLQDFNDNPDLNQGFKIVPAFIPETNIVSYVITYPHIIKNLKHLNLLTSRLYDRFSIKGDTVVPFVNYMVAKEEFEYVDISHTNIIDECNIDNPQDKKITLFSSVIMNPLSLYVLEKNDHFYDTFWEEMVRHSQSILSEIMLKIITEGTKKRIKLLWVEDDEKIDEINMKLQREYHISQFVNIDFVTNIQEIESAFKGDYDVYIFDLNLKDKFHDNYDFVKIQKTISLVKELGNEKLCKVLFYSKFLNIVEIRDKVLTDLEKKIGKLHDYQKIPKENIDIDLPKIISGLYKIMSK